MRSAPALLLASAILALLSLAHGQAHAQAHANQPTLFTHVGAGPMPTFTLTDQDGKPFTPEQLRGKVWVVHVFYTECTEGCMSKTLPHIRAIQDKIRGKSDLGIVSISVNPAIDTPELLSELAKSQSAQPGQWFFLSGPQETVHRAVQESLKQAVAHDPKQPKGKQFAHDWKLMIVDRDGQIVGYSSAKEMTHVAPFVERMRAVASERYVLPAVNATLNGLAGFLLVVGYFAIRNKRETLHRNVMLSALACSAIFLGCYLYYHFAVLRGQSPRLVGPGAVRIVYLTILISHTVLAAVVPVFAIWVTVNGFRDRRPEHRRMAKWTLPVWLYVSVTGVVVYVMLYHLYPPY